MNGKMEKYVIFDFDDTLVDNKLLDYESFKKPCIKLEIKSPSKNEIWQQRKDGLLAQEIIKNIQKKEKKVFSIDKFLNYRKIFLNSQESNLFLQLRKGTKELLSFLKKNNVTCFLCSVRSDKKLITNFLISNNVQQYFSGIFLARDIKINIDNRNSSNQILIKTSLIKQILKKTSSNNIIFVGDSEEDLMSANRLSIKFVLFEKLYLKKKFGDVIIKVINMKVLKNKLIHLLKLEK